MTDTDPQNSPGLTIDFVDGAAGHRLRRGEGRNQPLARAVGMARGRMPAIVDATAGLGRDAFLLASLGLHVTLIERSEQVGAALAAALARAAAAGGQHAEIAARMQLRHGEAKTLLPTLDPEVVLIDPMHPPRKKSALVKKQMRDLRALVGTDPDAPALIAAALACARERVVVKWPTKADAVPAPRPPSHTIAGKTTRYDVFMTG